jgi:hypothetical protein
MLFQYSEKHPPLEEQLYLFLKRFHTQPSEFFKLDKDLRDKLYKREFAMLKKEFEESEKLKNK